MQSEIFEFAESAASLNKLGKSNTYRRGKAVNLKGSRQRLLRTKSAASRTERNIRGNACNLCMAFSQDTVISARANGLCSARAAVIGIHTSPLASFVDMECCRTRAASPDNNKKYN